MWKRVEEHEQANGSFKHKGDMYTWVRRNLKTPIMYEQSFTYFKDEGAGKMFCSLCLAERVR